MHRHLLAVLGSFGLMACSGAAPDGPSQSSSSALHISPSGQFTAGVSAPSSAVYVGGDEANVVFRGSSGSLWLGTAMPGSAWSWTEVAGAGSLASDPSIVVRLNTGEKDIVARGPGNTLVYFWNTGSGWYHTAIPGLGAFSEPSLFVRDSGEADIVVQGPNGALDYYYATPGANWSMTEIAPAGTTFSAPSIFVRSSGEADVVAQGPSNTLMYYYAWPGTSWSRSQVAPQWTTFSRPSIFVRSSTEADIVARGPGNALMYYWAYPGSGWASTEITATDAASDPSVFVRDKGEADVVVNAPDGSLRYFFATPGSAWSESQINGPVSPAGPPSIFVRSGGEADVVSTLWGTWNNSVPLLMGRYHHATPGASWADDANNWMAFFN